MFKYPKAKAIENKQISFSEMCHGIYFNYKVKHPVGCTQNTYSPDYMSGLLSFSFFDLLIKSRT